MKPFPRELLKFLRETQIIASYHIKKNNKLEVRELKTLIIEIWNNNILDIFVQGEDKNKFHHYFMGPEVVGIDCPEFDKVVNSNLYKVINE